MFSLRFYNSTTSVTSSFNNRRHRLIRFEHRFKIRVVSIGIGGPTSELVRLVKILRQNTPSFQFKGLRVK